MTTKPTSRSKIKKRHAILFAQALSYALIITFIFANESFNLIGALSHSTEDSGTAYFAACLIGIVGSISLWLTWYYATKTSSIRDMLVICAWTNRVKSNGNWISMEEFFTDQLGYAVSHGISETKLLEMRNEVDTTGEISLSGKRIHRHSAYLK